MIPPLVNNAGETARACCRNEPSGGSVRIDRGVLDTALHTDSVVLFDIVKTATASLVLHHHLLARDCSKTRRLISRPQDVTHRAKSGASPPRPHLRR